MNRDTNYLQAAADRMMILDLLGRYAWELDHGKPEGWADCFTEDGIFEAPDLKFRVAGRARLTEFARDVHRTLPNVHHVMTNHMIDLADDEAHGKCALNEFMARPEGMYSNLQGWYEDDYRFDGRQWRIRHRRAYVAEPQSMALGKIGEYFQQFFAAATKFSAP
jgi:hypothetical protein